MTNFSKVSFVKSAPTLADRPSDNLFEVCFVGKSNVGKSSLINALCKQKKLAYTSSKPGYTKLLNYYLIDNKFYLVDAPGYGYTASGNKHLDSFATMMESYFDNPHLKGVIFLVDSRHKMSNDDVMFYEFIKGKNIPFVLITTKVDKLNQSEKAKMKKNVKEAFGDIVYLPCSKDEPVLIDKIRETIVHLVLN